MSDTTVRSTWWDEEKMTDEFRVHTADGTHFAGLVGEAARHLLPLAAKYDVGHWLAVTVTVDSRAAIKGCERGPEEAFGAPYTEVHGTFREIRGDSMVFVDGVEVALDKIVAFVI